jgi:lysophospholipase L1-like esterase
VIRKYNRIIQELVAEANEKLNKKRFYLVDISKALSDMALKRNNYNPPYVYPEFFKYSYPKVDTRYYGTTRDAVINSGGLFSLDGVHPTAIGQGLIALEFLKVMKIAGSYAGNVNEAIDWQKIFTADNLYSKPIGLLGEIYDNIEFKKWAFKKFFN